MQYFRMIDPRIRVLQLVSERGTVTAAADALSYTPSAVSHQIRSLSRELGITLLEPVGRGVRLTAAAQILLRRADELHARWEEIRAELAEAGQEEHALLRLCGFSTAAAALLPAVAEIVDRVHPYCSVRIIEADPVDCFDLLLTEKADIAVVVATPSIPPRTDHRFEQATLLDDPLDLLVPEGHPLAQREKVLLSEAAEENWILDHPGRPHHQLVLSACAEAGFRPHAAHDVAEWETGAALVSARLGVALIPRLARLPEGYQIVRVPLDGEPSPARHILTGVRRGSSRQPVIATALNALTTTVRSWERTN